MAETDMYPVSEDGRHESEEDGAVGELHDVRCLGRRIGLCDWRKLAAVIDGNDSDEI